ncbi:glycosyltransferase family 4 protein [Granulicella mallensis]|uniref:Glycosyltransferase involved in cell wall biosynthesis n=1 Tax=Granulicella mallensis TaxID=940614 RepID=A0A7W7ZST6_9BACT|nr:glycosyltransferase family 4 protein [Granulicella mallensis]MBB5065129.1 glycosyltransferase involved in cell wall biosynthesis [Granulicella mallensis]
MNILQFVSYRRSISDFKVADRNGSAVATNDMTMACLQHSGIQQVYALQSDGRKSQDDKWFSRRDLPSELQNKISVCYPDQLSDIVSNKPVIGLAAFPYFSAMAECFGAVKASIPVCSLVHAIPTPRLMDNFLSQYLFAQASDSIVVTSTAGRDAITNIFNQLAEILNRLGIKSRLADMENIIHVLPLATESAMLREVDQTLARDVLGLPQVGRVILYSGRLNAGYKADLEPLIRVIADMRRRVGGIRLLIAGHEEQAGYKEALLQIAHDCNVSDLVDFRLDFPSYLKRYIYASADVFVSPVDNVQETFGLSVVEAMASGLPVVAPNWSGYRDLIKDGITGFLVDTWIESAHQNDVNVTGAINWNADAERILASRTIIDIAQMTKRIELVLSSDKLRLSMAAEARRTVNENYTWSAVIDRFIALWESQIIAASIMQKSRAYLDFDNAFNGYARAEASLKEVYAYCPEATIGDLERTAKHRSSERKALIAATSYNYGALVEPFPVGELLDPGSASHSMIVNLLKRGILQIT